MKNQFLKMLILVIILTSCSKNRDIKQVDVPVLSYSGTIFLYGETHGNERILLKEFEIWKSYYSDGMRHLFIELPYFTAEYLNIWMEQNDDEILNQLFHDSKGTAGNNQYSYDFYKKIKEQCPYTIFHGTDLGHQYDSTGKRYLTYLENNNLSDSVQYELCLEAIEQGKKYYQDTKNSVYRENVMVKNFIREIKSIENESIMGIYGAAHTGLEDLNYTEEIPNMANQLNTGINNIISTDLSLFAKDIEATRIETIILNNKEYNALYYGRQELNSFPDYIYREFWIIEDAFFDFKDCFKTRQFLPYNNYPMIIELNQLFKIVYTKNDGSIEETYYISNGRKWKDRMVTESISIDHKNLFEYIFDRSI